MTIGWILLVRWSPVDVSDIACINIAFSAMLADFYLISWVIWP